MANNSKYYTVIDDGKPVLEVDINDCSTSEQMKRRVISALWAHYSTSGLKVRDIPHRLREVLPYEFHEYIQLFLMMNLR